MRLSPAGQYSTRSPLAQRAFMATVKRFFQSWHGAGSTHGLPSTQLQEERSTLAPNTASAP